MARQQSFPSHRRQGFQGSQESQRDQEQPFRSEEADWRGGRPRGDYFNAMEDRGYAAQSSWDEDRYGYPEATRYGREMNRSQRGYGPEGRFAQDPYEQQRGYGLGGRQGWPQDQGGRGGQDWSSSPSRGQYGSGHPARDYSQDFGDPSRSPGPWSGSPESWYGQQGNWGSEGAAFGSQRGQPGGNYGYGQRQEFGQQRQTPKGYTRSDERIRDDVCEHLYRNHDVDVANVSVEVKGGAVTLEGTVPDRRMKHRIEDICEQCIGVSDVENRIRVSREAQQGSAGIVNESEENERSRKASARH